MAEIAARIAELRRQIERDRFAGGDPVVALAPDLDPAETAARVLAAERSRALLAIGDARHNPSEDLADDALRGAIGALRTWGFGAARARLDEAAEGGRIPAIQQRVALFKALTRHLSALVYTPLGERLRLGLADLDEATRPLDLLEPAEKLHYRDELDRLIALREAAERGDPVLLAAWLLLRAQLAMGAGQDEAALVWLLRLASAQPVLESDGYLADLVARARADLAAQIGLPSPAPDESAAKRDPVRPRELFNALAARFTADLGRDVVAAMQQFALAEWVTAGTTADEGTGAKNRRGGKGR